jgi:hypothetical protein
VSYLLENNRRWVHNKTQEDPDFFKRQVAAHHPEYLFIGCSDARLSVQNMLGLEVYALLHLLFMYHMCSVVLHVCAGIATTHCSQ